MKYWRLFALFFFLFASFFPSPLTGAGTKNILPRLPEFVIERGYSDSFQVLECVVASQIYESTAESSLRVVLKNVAEKKVETAVKVRILYLTSDRSAQLFVNGKSRDYDRKNPRIPFSLEPGQTIDLQVKAKHTIEFSLEAWKKEKLESPSSSASEAKKKPRFDLSDLSRLFDNEKFGRRFMVGPLVSKWGIFPVDFQHVKLEINVPSDFVGIFPGGTKWRKNGRGNGIVYSFEGTEGYNGALFLPKTDLKSDFPASPEGITVSTQAPPLK